MLFHTLIEKLHGSDVKKAVFAENSCEIYDVALIDGESTEYPPHILYFGYYAQTAVASRMPPQCILAHAEIPPFDAARASNIAIVEESALFRVFNQAKNLIQAEQASLGMAGELSLLAASKKNVQALLDSAALTLGASLVLLDAGLKILAHSTVFQTADPLWSKYIERGYCQYELIQYANKFILQDALRTPPVMEVLCPVSPARRMVGKILRGGAIAGYLLLLEQTAPITGWHMEMLSGVSQAVGEAVLRYEPYLFAASAARHGLLDDLLAGARPEDVRDRAAALRSPARLCALSIQAAAAGAADPRKMREDIPQALNALLPRISLTFHKDSLAALLPLDKSLELSGEHCSVLQKFAGKTQLRIGVSNTFSRIEDFARYHDQACKALAADGNDPVCRYRDHVFDER
jgi:hypothetical protein